MDSAKPSAELVRSVTDKQVLSVFFAEERLTRAELAARTGISKPTAGESVRRLSERGLIVDTGDRTPGGRGKGRVGSYYSLAPDVGSALGVSIAADGIIAERIDARGDIVRRVHQAIDRPAQPERVAKALRQAVLGAVSGESPTLAVLGAADPVDRATGRLIQLPDAAFLVGELDPVEILAPIIDGPVVVDNDVNWAARAERDGDPDLRDFAYLYLGEGLGCAVVSEGEVLRGHAGFAGEISHLITEGPDGTAIRFIDVFGRLGLRQTDSTAINVPLLLKQCADNQGVRDAIGRALGSVVAATIALADPEVIVLGGPWGPQVMESVRDAVERSPRYVKIRAAAVTSEPVLTGVRADAVLRLRTSIASRA